MSSNKFIGCLTLIVELILPRLYVVLHRQSELSIYAGEA